MESVTVQMERLLSEYSEEVQNVTNEAADKVAKECVKKLKSSSPKRPGHGQYARGWKVKKERGQGGGDAAIVHNTQYQLTHLLENGHVIRNAKGTYGRAPAHKHIEPVERWGVNEFQSDIKERLE